MNTPRPAVMAAAGLAMLALLPAQTAWSAWPHDPFTNVQVAPFSFNQFPTAMVSDGAGGVIVVWKDRRSGNFDIFAQRLTAAGTVSPGWPPTGLAVCVAAGEQGDVVAAPDGAGGAVVAWPDYRANAASADIYAMRINGNGTLAAGWPADGRLLSSILVGNHELAPAITPDGSGGAIVAWELVFTPGTDDDVYAAHVSGTGTVVWEKPIVNYGSYQSQPRICTDGAGGAIVAFIDNISSGNFDIRAVRITDGLFPPWGTVDVSVQVGDQLNPTIASDGVGGAVIAWQDSRSGPADIYAQHLTASGARAPGWGTTGNPVCTAVGDQQYPAIVSDGGQGALITWVSGGFTAVAASRISVAGSTYPGWPANGVTLAAGSSAPVLVSDGAGGAIVSWMDQRSGAYDIYASRLTGAGTLAPGWTSGGTPISTAAADQGNPVIAADGAGGAILAWYDQRSGSSYAAFAQRVDLFGQLGNAEPTIARIKDLPGDQGGHVRVDWNASYLDVNPTFGVSSYWIWRQAPLAQAMRAVRAGARWLGPDLDARARTASASEWNAIASRGLYMTSGASADAFAWEYIASQPASGFPTYSYVASTTRDSLPGSNPYTPFMVQARAVSGGAFWGSAADSGYSVDNLPPAMPQPFTGAFASGAVHLHWGANAEADLGGYRLYRGSSAGFVPGPGNLVTAQPDTGYTDNVGVVSYYKLSAVDAHGNESPFASLGPSGTLEGPPAAAPRELALALASANPAREGAVLRLALPRETALDLAVFDVHGRRIRQLAHGVYAAGERAVRWDGRDAGGARAASGLYIIRLEADGHARTIRLVLAR